MEVFPSGALGFPNIAMSPTPLPANVQDTPRHWLSLCTQEGAGGHKQGDCCFHPHLYPLVSGQWKLPHTLREDVSSFWVPPSTLPWTQGQNNLDQAFHPSRRAGQMVSQHCKARECQCLTGHSPNCHSESIF